MNLLGFFPGPLDDRARRTFANDCLRQITTGLTDTGPRTFFLLIAVQRFSASDLFKSLISIPGGIGMALSVFLIPLLAARSRHKTRWLAAARMLAGLCYLMAAWNPSLTTYTLWILLGGLPASIVYPLLTSVYHENYPHRIRGQLFAWAAMVNMASSALFNWIIGSLLGPHSEHYAAMLTLFGFASLLTAWSFLRMPSSETDAPQKISVRRSFRWVLRDRHFAYMLLIWSVFGSAIFMISPLKILFLTEPKYGLTYPTATVALIIGILPEIFRMASTPFWARFFDRYHFIGIRIILNAFLLASMLAFFFGRTKSWLCAASILEGLSTGGANIAWALWVTHVAPVGHTSEYMAVNQFFTGLRAIAGTIIGIRLATVFGLQQVAWACIALVSISILMMIPIRNDRKWKCGDVATKEETTAVRETAVE